MKVALVQYAVDDRRSVPEDIELMTHAVASAAAHGAELVVLPELWGVGAFNADAWESRAMGPDGRYVERARAWAQQHRITLHAGSYIERDASDPDQLFNTSVLSTPDGAIQATYRKMHLFAAAGREGEILRSGSDVVVTQVPQIPARIGLATCYDLRFPEFFRALTKGVPHAGAELCLVVASWPKVRREHWRALAVARAIENQMWVVACNASGTTGGMTMGGHSMVVSPTGEIVAEGRTREDLVLAEIDLGEVREARDAFPAWADRRLA